MCKHANGLGASRNSVEPEVQGRATTERQCEGDSLKCADHQMLPRTEAMETQTPGTDPDSRTAETSRRGRKLLLHCLHIKKLGWYVTHSVAG